MSAPDAEPSLTRAWGTAAGLEPLAAVPHVDASDHQSGYLTTQTGQYVLGYGATLNAPTGS
jgi:hypothetical protein